MIEPTELIGSSQRLAALRRKVARARRRYRILCRIGQQIRRQPRWPARGVRP